MCAFPTSVYLCIRMCLIPTTIFLSKCVHSIRNVSGVNAFTPTAICLCLNVFTPNAKCLCVQLHSIPTLCIWICSNPGCSEKTGKLEVCIEAWFISPLPRANFGTRIRPGPLTHTKKLTWSCYSFNVSWFLHSNNDWAGVFTETPYPLSGVGGGRAIVPVFMHVAKVSFSPPAHNENQSRRQYISLFFFPFFFYFCRRMQTLGKAPLSQW